MGKSRGVGKTVCKLVVVEVDGVLCELVVLRKLVVVGLAERR